MKMEHKKFNYKSLEDIIRESKKLNVELPLSKNIEALGKEIYVNGTKLANRIGIQPMEGADSSIEGNPTDLTRQRYMKFAESGASLIWFEAVAITPEGRSSRKQLTLREENLSLYQELIKDIKERSLKVNGFEPMIVMQANHSGRYAKPNGKPEPIIAYNHPIYEKDNPIDSSRIATDDYLKNLEEKFGEAAKLCERAGFDAMDVKSCHGYLFAELASAFTREGDYGGSFENRFRLLVNSIKSAKSTVTSPFSIVARIGIYDGFPYPYGFGVEKEGLGLDVSEPIKLIDILHNQLSIGLINITMGNPYQNPHVTRPHDIGNYIPPEHPIEGLARMYKGCGEIKKAFPNLTIMSSAASYLREFSCNLAAGSVEQGKSDIVGFGRLAFAYEKFAQDILNKKELEKNQCCITCGKCAELLRAGTPTGCVIRNKTYLEIYKDSKAKKEGR